MGINYLRYFVFLCALPVFAGQAVAQDWYIAPSAVFTDDDDDRIVDDMVGGGEVKIGRFLSDNFALEGTLGTSSLDGVDDLDIFEASLNGVVTFGRENLITPYVMGGFGVVSQDSRLFGDESAPILNAGVGFNVRFGDSPVGIKAEHRFRFVDNDTRGYTDRISTLGLTFAFGRGEPPPPPVVAPPPDPDSDNDGVSDSRDACPNTPAGHRVDSRGCSLDGDGDGVADANDACPNTFRGASVDNRGCELDDDKDGVVNRLDRCPNTTAGVRVDVNGCEIREVIELPGVNFESNSDRLLPGADGVLRDAAATLRRYPDLVVEVAGHTDSAGAADYNQGLSERRANTVRDYLINAGVRAANLSARGYGEAEPIADNGTSTGRARNRRVELRIIE